LCRREDRVFDPGDPNQVTHLRGDIISKDLLSISMLLGGTRIGDLIVQGNYSKTTEPLLQFARHIRNACAHGTAGPSGTASRSTPPLAAA
jgi:hypothetical protein